MTNNRTITNQPSRDKRRKYLFESTTRARRISLKKHRVGISLPRKVTLFVNFSTGLYLKEEEKEEEEEEEEGVTVIRLIQPRLEIHPSGNVQGMCIFNNGNA